MSKCCILYLNDMRSPQIEMLRHVVKAATKEELKAFLARERVESYRDGRWGKVFREGGPLEWFNEPWAHDERRHFVEIDVDETVARHAETIRGAWRQQPSIFQLATPEDLIEMYRADVEKALAEIPWLAIDTVGIDADAPPLPELPAGTS